MICCDVLHRDVLCCVCRVVWYCVACCAVLHVVVREKEAWVGGASSKKYRTGFCQSEGLASQSA